MEFKSAVRHLLLTLFIQQHSHTEVDKAYLKVYELINSWPPK
jgi:hypothetical protein